ncbi:metal ABC transporter substrate-binding protein [Dendrosporobacter sp. 1207_IL3150]|uniref:metal ABC transporter substrate-binding protein n=1 Tax=Dendrosporobacter sp. 1207_IL3150 TaxID=3084054 RepID=UPI002FD88B91
MLRTRRPFLLMLICLLVLLTGCGSKVNQTQSNIDKMKIVTTVYPVYEFVRQVGGDKVDVVMLVNPGVEPHDWEPTAKELMQIRSAKLFFYHGAGLEPMEKLLTKEVLGTAQAFEVSKGIALIEHSDEKDAHKHEHDQEKAHKEDEHNHDADSHIWLDPVAAQQEINNIAEALVAADPANRDYYLKNAEKFNSELIKLDQEYRLALNNVARRDLVTSHAAFGYLAKRYDLHQIAIMGLSPDSEPTPDKMAEIVNFCRENSVKYIFFETLVSPKLSQAIAAETGAGLLVLNPIESLTEDEIKQGKSYITIMKENLINLKKALD